MWKPVGGKELWPECLVDTNIIGFFLVDQGGAICYRMNGFENLMRGKKNS